MHDEKTDEIGNSDNHNEKMGNDEFDQITLDLSADPANVSIIFNNGYLILGF